MTSADGGIPTIAITTKAKWREKREARDATALKSALRDLVERHEYFPADRQLMNRHNPTSAARLGGLASRPRGPPSDETYGQPTSMEPHPKTRKKIP